MKQFIILFLVFSSLNAMAQTVTRDFASVAALRSNTKIAKKGEKIYVKSNESIYTYDHTDTTTPDDGVFTVVQAGKRWKCTSCKSKQIVKNSTAPTTQTTLDNNYLLYQNTTTGSVYANNQSSPEPWQLLVSGTVSYNTDINILLHGGGDNVDGTSMKTVYSDQSFIPSEEPYTGLFYERETGGEIATGDLSSITDWVLVELRDKSNPKLVRYTKAGLLHKTGVIYDMDASTKLTFSNVAEDLYYVAIKHRNHMGIMTATAVNPASTLNFAGGTTPYWNPENISNYLISLNGKLWLRTGKTNLSGIGTQLGILGGYNDWEVLSNEFAEGYHVSDYNLDRFVDAVDYSVGIDNHLLSQGVWEELIPEFGKQTNKLILREMINPRAILLSRGDNASEPLQAPTGAFRFNTETDRMRVFTNSGWIDIH
jgi:hypothetical protein